MTHRRPGSRYSDFLRRLRARPLSSWELNGRTSAARAAVCELAILGWDRPGPMPPVPDLGPHALADQLEVLLLDAERSGADPDRLDQVMVALAEQLSLRLN